MKPSGSVPLVFPIARYRDEEGAQSYKALGEYSQSFEFDQAKAAAENWFRDVERGISGRDDDGKPPTVASACRSYVEALRAEGRLETAQADATCSWT